MELFDIVKAAYEGCPDYQKRFLEQLGQTVMRLEQAIGSYKTALMDVRRCVEHENGVLAAGYMPSMIGLVSQAERAMDLQREIKDLTDRTTSLMWGLEWSEGDKHEVHATIQALLAGK